MEIYTIGFEGKSAQEFLELMKANRIEKLVDIRIYPNSDDAGFASQRDLPYLLREIADCDYAYRVDLAPTPKLLDDVHRDNDHEKYTRGFNTLMDERGIPENLERSFFADERSCLLCFEASPEFCHRRMVAERIRSRWPDLEIVHL